MIIGICGGSGSGKTTLLRKICKDFSRYEPSVFSLDNYYLPIESQQKDNNGIVNFDLPTALNRGKIIKDLKMLVEGIPIKVKEYNFNCPPYLNKYIEIKPSRLIIVEGLFLFHYKELLKMLDMTVYVVVDSEIQLKRRLKRDKQHRGYSEDEIIYQWENHVNPCYNQFIQPYKSQADYIFRNDDNANLDFLNLKRKLMVLMDSNKFQKSKIVD